MTNEALTADGLPVTDLVFRVGGQIRMNASDNVHRAFMSRMRLGALVELRCFATVGAKGWRRIEDSDGNETVMQSVVAMLDTVDVA